MTNPELDAYEKHPADYMASIAERDEALETSVYLMRDYRLRIAELEAEKKQLGAAVEETAKLCGQLKTENERLRKAVGLLVPLVDANCYEYGRTLAAMALGETL